MIASFPDSVAKFRGALIEAMQENQLEVHLAVPDIGASSIVQGSILQLGVRLHHVPINRTGTNPLVDAWLCASLFLKMLRLRPLFTLAYTIKPVVYGTLAAWLARVPRRYALITGLGYAFTSERRGPLKRIVSLLYRFALGRAQMVFFQNPDDERLFRHLGILPDAIPSVVVNGSGVDLDAYRSQSLPAGNVVFLMIGRLLGDKGVREYAQAARRLKATHPDLHFILAGWIDANPDAIAQSELDDWIADGTIEFLGKLDDVRPAIGDCSVYVLPSYREGTPRTVLEAMAMGRPIITTDAPGCRETVVDGDNGFLVPVQSVDALVENMMKFIEDPTLAPRMGKRSREIAEEKYDVHKVNAMMLREMGIMPAPREAADGQ